MQGSGPCDPGSIQKLFKSSNPIFSMIIGTTFFIMAVLVVAIWVLIEVKRMKHKIFAIILIALIIFSYVSASVIFKEQDIDFKTVPGLIDASKIYFSWLGSVFGNLKTITANVIKMDWGLNKTSMHSRR